MAKENQFGNFFPIERFLPYFHVICSDVRNVFCLLLAVPEPIAFYPLNARYKAAEKENRQPKGILGNVAITNGPYNEPGGAHIFYGTVSSYIEFPNIWGLDTWLSYTLMCWVQPGGHDGPLFSYEKDHQKVQILTNMGRFTLIFQPREFYNTLSLLSDQLLPIGLWVHVAATFDHNTGAQLFINGHLSRTNGELPIAISTNKGEVRMGAEKDNDAYFKGKITELKVYDVALNKAQIETLIRQGN